MSDLTTTARELTAEAHFRQWLARETGLSGRSLGDVVSRAKRAAALVDLASPLTRAEVDFRLAGSEAFGACSPSVRSQLRRAARLYAHYRSGGA